MATTKTATTQTEPTASETILTEPIEIYGNWKVKNVKVVQGADIGIKAGKSKFKIKNKGTKHVLQKQGNAADVRWDPNKQEITLTEVPSTDRDFARGFALMATVKLDNVSHELKLGSKDHGVSLQIQLMSTSIGQAHPGGSGSAGRGLG